MGSGESAGGRVSDASSVVEGDGSCGVDVSHCGVVLPEGALLSGGLTRRRLAYLDVKYRGLLEMSEEYPF